MCLLLCKSNRWVDSVRSGCTEAMAEIGHTFIHFRNNNADNAMHVGSTCTNNNHRIDGRVRISITWWKRAELHYGMWSSKKQQTEHWKVFRAWVYFLWKNKLLYGNVSDLRKMPWIIINQRLIARCVEKAIKLIMLLFDLWLATMAMTTILWFIVESLKIPFLGFSCSLPVPTKTVFCLIMSSNRLFLLVVSTRKMLTCNSKWFE